MKRQNHFENAEDAKPGKDRIVKVVDDCRQPINIDADRLATNVLNRINNRRRGSRRLAGSAAAMFALAIVGVFSFAFRSDQHQDLVAQAEFEPTMENGVVIQHPGIAELLDEEFKIREAADRLQQLKEELAVLRQIEYEQQLALARERLSQSLTIRINHPYPVFLGE